MRASTIKDGFHLEHLIVSVAGANSGVLEYSCKFDATYGFMQEKGSTSCIRSYCSVVGKCSHATPVPTSSQMRQGPTHMAVNLRRRDG